MSTYEVGQTLVYVPDEKRRGGPDHVVVTKVARKWVSFKGEGRYAHENRFDKDTGAVDGAGFSSPGRIYRTMEEYQAKLDLDAAVQALRERLDWRGGPLPKDLTAQRVRLAMGLLLVGGDTDPLQALRDSHYAMKRVVEGTDWNYEDLQQAIRLIEQLGIGGPVARAER